MKRTLATVLSLATFLSFSTPAFAYGTKNFQPRLDLRALKGAAVSSYKGRHSRAFTRARYNALVQRMMPSLLAVTGDAAADETTAPTRPGTRMIDNMVLSDHCVSTSRRCGGENH